MQLPSPIGQNPSLPSPFYTSAFATSSGTSSSKYLAADVQNSQAAVNQPCGFNIPVVTGIPITITFELKVNVGNINGVTVVLLHPGSTNGIAYINGNTNSANGFGPATVTVGASPFTLVLSSTFLTYSGNGTFQCTVTFTPSGSGNVDLAFKPIVDTQVITVRAGSAARAF